MSKEEKIEKYGNMPLKTIESKVILAPYIPMTNTPVVTDVEFSAESFRYAFICLTCDKRHGSLHKRRACRFNPSGNFKCEGYKSIMNKYYTCHDGREAE